MSKALCLLVGISFGLRCLAPETVFADELQFPALGELKELMHGEEVLSSDRASLLAPLARMKGQPWFEISNVRPGSNLSIALEFDYACAGDYQGSLHAVVLTNGRKYRFPISHAEFKRRRGEILCSYSVISDKQPFGRNVEVYIEMTDADPVSNSSRYRHSSPGVRKVEVRNPLYFKVSTSVLRGENQNKTLARSIRQDEFDIYARRKKKYGPPPPAPAGYMKAQNYWPIVPGTPALVAIEGEWEEAEILEFRTDGKLTVDIPKLSRSMLIAASLDAVALSIATIKVLKESPEQFSPSIVIVPGSLRRPPPGHILIPDRLVIPRGLPLQYNGSEVLFVDQIGDSVTILATNFLREQSVARSQLLVAQSALKSIENPASLASYESRLNRALKRAEDKYARRLPLDSPVRNYPIKIALPHGFERVTADTPLKEGDALMISYSSKWDRVTVRGLRESDRAVEIFWPSWHSNYFVSRETLIVAISESRDQSDAFKPYTRIIPDGQQGEPILGDGVRKGEAVTRNDVNGTPKTREKDSNDAGYKLVLVSAGPKSILTVKLVMEISDVDLSLAAAAIKALPMELKRGLNKNSAAEWSQRFQDAGAKVEVSPLASGK